MSERVAGMNKRNDTTFNHTVRDLTPEQTAMGVKVIAWRDDDHDRPIRWCWTSRRAVSGLMGLDTIRAGMTNTNTVVYGAAVAAGAAPGLAATAEVLASTPGAVVAVPKALLGASTSIVRGAVVFSEAEAAAAAQAGKGGRHRNRRASGTDCGSGRAGRGGGVKAGEAIAPKTAASFGKALSNDYRATFFAAHPELEGQVVVHHAVEQQVLTKFPGAVTEAEIHSLENLRGILNTINSDVHLSQIRVEWNRFYKPFIEGRTSPTKAQLLEKAAEIDAKFGSRFTPPVGGP